MPEVKDLTIGMDLGATKMLAALVDQGGRILKKIKMPTISDTRAAFEKHYISLVDQLLEAAPDKASRVAALGIGAAGLIDPATGMILEAPNIRELDRFNLCEPLARRFPFPVCVDNDVNVGTYGEYMLGAGQGAQSVIGLFIGTGIGGGLILDGQIYHGFTKTAGEIGHMVIKFDGRKHPLKTSPRGTLEAYAARLALVDRIRKTARRDKHSVIARLVDGNWSDLKSGMLKKAYQQNDESVVRIINRAAEHVGIGLSSLVHILSPEVIVIGGGVIEALGDVMMPRIIDTVNARSLQAAIRGVKIRESQLRDNAIVLGAAMLARNRL